MSTPQQLLWVRASPLTLFLTPPFTQHGGTHLEAQMPSLARWDGMIQLLLCHAVCATATKPTAHANHPLHVTIPAYPQRLNKHYLLYASSVSKPTGPLQPLSVSQALLKPHLAAAAASDQKRTSWKISGPKQQVYNKRCTSTHRCVHVLLLVVMCDRCLHRWSTVF